MSEVKLKPCPFCGGEAKISTYDWGYSVKEYWIYCHSCDCASGSYHSKEEAIETWNRRKPMDDIVERLEECEEYEAEAHNYNASTAFNKAIEIVKGGVED